MTIETDLVTWAEARPVWQREVLLRLCRQETFGDEAISALADRLVTGQSIMDVTLTAADIPGNTVTAAGVELTALQDLIGINALPTGQRLSFGEKGLTVIYGDNASGKSGYARVLKSALGRRMSADILSNVFELADTQQNAVVEYRARNNGPDEQWKWPDEPNPHLQQMHFYDEISGDTYLTTESEISYRPSALALLDQLITVCDAVREELGKRLRVIDASKQSMPAVPDGTSAARFIAALSESTTVEDIDAESMIPVNASEDLARLLSEETRLKTSNPAKEKQRLLNTASHMDNVIQYCNDLATNLSAEKISELRQCRISATELRAAAQVASSQNFNSEPVQGVGSGTWRSLWEAARAFSEHEAYHQRAFPVTSGGARCVLCQQELSAEAGDRLQRFQDFMLNTAERAATEAERLLSVRRNAMREFTQLPTSTIASVNAIRMASGFSTDAIEAWIAEGVNRAAAALHWLEGSTEPTPTALDAELIHNVEQRAQELRDQAAVIDDTAFSAKLRSVTERVANLQAKIAINSGKNALVNEVRRLSQRAHIESARRATDTGAITRKSSELTRQYVTREVRDQFTRESERLRLRRITLDHTSGVKGRLLHRPALLGAAGSADVARVLSEGEQTALGLSGFFTEVIFDLTRSAVVLDDPVTSLDHIRRSLVAQRLIELAADRQVIIFTHEVTFVSDLIRHAFQARIPITERWIQRKADIIGVCSETLPWKAKDVAARINVLTKDLAALRRDRGELDQEEYDERCASWAGKLSESWERAVNLEIVGEVVDRGTSQVRPMKFRILAAITKQDDDDFQAGYGRCSEWARRHDKDPCINYVSPELDDMTAELDRFDQWFKRIKGYRK